MVWNECRESPKGGVMRKGELREKAVYGVSDVISEIASNVESIMDYINGAKGIESDSEILETVNADIENLWSSLN